MTGCAGVAAGRARACGGRAGAPRRRAAVRAHHVARCARIGDPAAIALLCEAGDASAVASPAVAAHWFAVALRLLGGGASSR